MAYVHILLRVISNYVIMNKCDVILQALGSRENGRNDSSDEETPAGGGDEQNGVIPNGHASPTHSGTSDQTEPQETTKEQNGTTTSDQTEPQETKEEQPNGRQLEAEKKVESSMDIEGKVEVVTSVKVQASGSDQEEEEEEEGEKREEVERQMPDRKISTEVAIAEVTSALTITMIRENTVDVPASDTESDGT